MTDSISSRTANAVSWRAAQMLGDKLINLVRVVVLARLLAPEDFGLVALSAITVELAMRLSDTGMLQALVQRQRLLRAHYDVAWTIQMLRAGLVAAVVIVAAPLLAYAFNEPRAEALMRGLAARVVVLGAVSTRVADLHRQLRFRGLALIHLAEALTGFAVAVALAPVIGVWALVLGPFAGAVVQLALSYWVAPYLPRITFDREALSQLFRFGQWIFAEGVLAVVGTQVLQLVIARQLGVEELGLYYLAVRLAFLPSSIASEIVGAVAFPLYSRLQGMADAAARAMSVTLMGLAVIVLPASLFLAALATPIVEHVLGERWSGCAPIIAGLALVGVVGMVGDVMVPMFKGLGHPRAAFQAAGLQYVLLVGLCWMLIGEIGINAAAAAWVLAVGITQVFCIRMMRRYIPAPFAGTLPVIATVAACSAAGAYLAGQLASNWPGVLGLLGAALIGLGVVAGSLVLGDRLFRLRLVDTLLLAYPRLRHRLRPGNS